jgi:hypothetical protein
MPQGPRPLLPKEPGFGPAIFVLRSELKELQRRTRLIESILGKLHKAAGKKVAKKRES